MRLLTDALSELTATGHKLLVHEWVGVANEIAQNLPTKARRIRRRILFSVVTLYGRRPGEMERAKALLQVGADVLVVDSSQGDSVFQADLVKQLKLVYPDAQVSRVGTKTYIWHFLAIHGRLMTLGAATWPLGFAESRATCTQRGLQTSFYMASYNCEEGEHCRSLEETL